MSTKRSRNFDRSLLCWALGSVAVALVPAIAIAAQSAARVDESRPHPQPPYPDSAQVSGERGVVLVNVLVKPSGRPSRATVVQSSGFGDLDTAAVQGVLNWRFVPAMRDGDAVSDWTSVKIVFELPQAPAPSN
jgi:protein TonB